MNILFLSSWYPNKKFPLLGNFVERHAQAVSLNHSVFVLHATSLKGITTIKQVHEKKGKVEVYLYYYPRSSIPFVGKLFNAYLNFFCLRKGFKKIERKHKLDLVHLQVIRPLGYFALYLKSRFKKRYVITEHWTGFLPSNNFFETLPKTEKKLIKRVAKKSDAVFPVSHNLGQQMLSKGIQAEYVTIPNVVDTQVFRPSEQLPEKPYFLHVSHLKPEHKNPKGLLNGFRSFVEENHSALLKIVCDEDISQTEKWIRNLGLENNVEVLRALPYQEVAELMKKAKAFVLFSNYENLPCVLLEAMSCGCPVISTPVGGIAEYFGEFYENGILVEKENEQALSTALHRIWNDEVTFDKKKMRDFAEKNFSYQAVADKYATFYKLVVESDAA